MRHVSAAQLHSAIVQQLLLHPDPDGGAPPAPPAPPADPPAAPVVPPADPPAPPVDPPAPPVVDPAVPPVTPPALPPADPPAAPVVPETYALPIPEHSGLDQADVDHIAAMGKAKGWTQDQATAALAELGQALTAQRAAFRAEVDAHPEVGGAHLAAAQEHALRALDRFLPATEPDGAVFRAAMKKSGYDSYAPLVLLLSRIGKAMAEDTPLGSTAASRTAPSADSRLARLYPSMAPRP